jgi:DNA-binding MarR family transcriptional regulator
VREELNVDPAAAAAEYVQLSSDISAAVRSAWKEADLTLTQLRALLALQRRGALSVGDLARSLGVGLSAASHLVDRMAPLGLIERDVDPTDRRRALLRLTRQSAARLDSLLGGSQDDIRRLLARMAPAEIAALLVGLRALAAAARAETTAPGGPAGP